MGVELDNDDWERVGHAVPLLVDMQPAGRFLGEDFFRAGGVPAVVAELLEAGALPHPDAVTANGHTIAENCAGRLSEDREVIRSYGEPILRDAIAAVGVALMVAKIGWDLGWDSLHELADSALEQERVEKIRTAILAVDGVRHLHLLRSRKVGHEALVDVHVQVDPWLSVSEGHMIAIAVEEAAKASLDEVTDVTVHIDPEDDEESPPCEGLPLRGQVLDMLEHAWKEAGCKGRWERVQLHYIQGRVHVDLYLPLACLDEEGRGAQSIRQELAGPLADRKEIGNLRIFFIA